MWNRSSVAVLVGVLGCVAACKERDDGRVHQPLTQADAAFKSGCGRATVADIEQASETNERLAGYPVFAPEDEGRPAPIPPHTQFLGDAWVSAASRVVDGVEHCRAIELRQFPITIVYDERRVRWPKRPIWALVVQGRPRGVIAAQPIDDEHATHALLWDGSILLVSGDRGELVTVVCTNCPSPPKKSVIETNIGGVVSFSVGGRRVTTVSEPVLNQIEGL